MQRHISGSRVLITGASSGIGRALALELAERGASLLLTARREERLRELERDIREKLSQKHAKTVIRYVVGDITDPALRKTLITTAQDALGGLDFLINNAGVGATSLIEETPEECTRRLMEVNYFSAHALTRAALPLLKQSSQDSENRKRRIRPIIVFLGSIVGLRGTPHYGDYGAAKFAVTGMSESLRSELRRDGIDVLLVSPGTTRTEFFDVLLESGSAPDFPAHVMVSSEYVASKIVRAMEKGKHRIIPYFPAKVLYWLNRFSPSLVDYIMSRYVSR